MAIDEPVGDSKLISSNLIYGVIFSNSYQQINCFKFRREKFSVRPWTRKKNIQFSSDFYGTYTTRASSDESGAEVRFCVSLLSRIFHVGDFTCIYRFHFLSEMKNKPKGSLVKCETGIQRELQKTVRIDIFAGSVIAVAKSRV